MKFRDFVKYLMAIDSPLGDLCGDIVGDKDFDDNWDCKRIEEYLQFRCGYDDRCKMITALVDLYRLGVK